MQKKKNRAKAKDKKKETPVETMSTDIESLIVSLYEIEAVKFGSFVLKSGISSPVYFDLRVIVSAPRILAAVAANLRRLATEKGIAFGNHNRRSARIDGPGGSDGEVETGVVSQLCGVPYTALPIATCMSTDLDVPMIIRRKEAKDYGTKKLLEGKWSAGDRCLVVEDVVTSGSSVLETAAVLRAADLRVAEAVVILDRQQGGKQKLDEEGIQLYSLFTISDVLKVLSEKRLIGPSVVESVQTFIAENQFSPSPPPPPPPLPKEQLRPVVDATKMKYGDRVGGGGGGGGVDDATFTAHLFRLMERKSSNLCVAADVTSAAELLRLAESVGPHICLLKTHVDIVEDFDAAFVEKLGRLAENHDFLLFEDRKFADIGNTVMAQYGKGVFKIADWADLVNAHPLPGPGVVEGLSTVAAAATDSATTPSRPKGCLLVAEMSSKGNLIGRDYAKSAVEMALTHRPFVCGFIAQSRLDKEHPELVFMTPGVSLASKGDKLGQSYETPETAIGHKGADVIIVGRGISGAVDPAAAAAEYRKAGWDAYMARIL